MNDEDVVSLVKDPDMPDSSTVKPHAVLDVEGIALDIKHCPAEDIYWKLTCDKVDFQIRNNSFKVVIDGKTELNITDAGATISFGNSSVTVNNNVVSMQNGASMVTVSSNGISSRGTWNHDGDINATGVITGAPPPPP